MRPPRTLRLAAVQVESRDGEAEANLARAGLLVAEAAARGARLVLCPELLAAGYLYDESIWEAGEPRDGATETWLRRLAAVHRIYLGAS
jgi:predicted amidohydrolase